MDVAIPPEFENFARAQVEAGVYASEADAVAAALRDHLARVEDLRAEVDPSMAEADRGEVSDARAVMRDLAARARARRGA